MRFVKPLSRAVWEVFIDHDHDTGAIRMLLCRNCNHCLGAAKDSPVLLDKMAAYLRKHGKV